MTDNPNLYEGIDKEQMEEVIAGLQLLAVNFNDGDLLVKNYIVNELFNFLARVIVQDEARQKLIDVYSMLE